MDEKPATTAELEKLIRRFALQNAVEFNGTASPGAVVGKVLGARKELRCKAKEIGPLVAGIVKDVNALTLGEQVKEFEEFREEAAREKAKKAHEREAKKGLPPLENAEDGVVMRFAPSPSGPLHIGHTRACILNDEYVKRYGGEFILRLEDTNPKNIELDAYDMIREDLDWLGVGYDKVIIQSDRMELYYEHARRLLEMECAYVCDCDVEFWRSRKLEMKACPHRGTLAQENLGRWEMMLDGTYNEGEASFVVKTDLEDPNPALRDFVGARIVEGAHPRTSDRFRVYPLYNFSVAIDDHLMKITHVLRGKDHLNNTYRQNYVYRYFEWEEPEFYHYGWVSIPDVELKTSNIKKKILNDEYTGWGDVRLGTLQALKQRGIMPEALRSYWKEVGMNPIDISFSWETLFAYNRSLIDPVANRYFFTADPRKVRITVDHDLEGKAPLHPDFPERGFRHHSLKRVGEGGGSYVVVYIDASDFQAIMRKSGKGKAVKLRLKDLCNIKVDELGEAELHGSYLGNDLSIIKTGVPIIHWTPPGSLKCELYKADGKMVDGAVEPSILNEKKELVQFERVGFVRIEKAAGSKNRGAFIKAFYAHR